MSDTPEHYLKTTGVRTLLTRVNKRILEVTDSKVITSDTIPEGDDDTYHNGQIIIGPESDILPGDGDENEDKLLSTLFTVPPGTLVQSLVPLRSACFYPANGTVIPADTTEYADFMAYMSQLYEDNYMRCYTYNDGSEDHDIYLRTDTIDDDTVLYFRNGIEYIGTDFTVENGQILYDGNACTADATKNYQILKCFITEAVWQETLEQKGVVRRFVYDRTTGSLRMPSCSGYIVVANVINTNIAVNEGTETPMTPAEIKAYINGLHGALQSSINSVRDDFDNSPHIVETYRNGTSWYRLYSDGWIEQGGHTTPTGSDVNTVITLIKEMQDTSYEVFVNMQWNGPGGASWQYICAHNLTTTQFEITRQASLPHNWLVAGFVKSENS